MLLRLPVAIHYHQQHFEMEEHDDVWLPVVGGWGWIVVGQDYNYHNVPAELYALRQYEMGCFYLWGSQAPRWDTMRVFAKAYDKIMYAAEVTPRPFVFDVLKSGALREVMI